MDNGQNEQTDRVVSSVAYPAAAVAEFASEAKQGRSWLTTVSRAWGTALMVAAAVVVILGLVFAGYYIVS